MPKKAAEETVTLRHPNGKFTVRVNPARAEQLAKRGYTKSTSKGK